MKTKYLVLAFFIITNIFELTDYLLEPTYPFITENEDRPYTFEKWYVGREEKGILLTDIKENPSRAYMKFFDTTSGQNQTIIVFNRRWTTIHNLTFQIKFYHSQYNEDYVWPYWQKPNDKRSIPGYFMENWSWAIVPSIALYILLYYNEKRNDS